MLEETNTGIEAKPAPGSATGKKRALEVSCMSVAVLAVDLSLDLNGAVVDREAF